MKIDLLPEENVLRTIEGRSFQPNPIARLIAKFVRLIGVQSKVVVSLTSKRCFVEEQVYILWSIPTERHVTVVSLDDISSILGIRTSFLLVFKSYNMVIQSGGTPLAGVNLKRMSTVLLDAEVTGMSLLKQNAQRAA